MCKETIYFCTDFHYEVAQEQMKKELIMRDMGIGFIIKDEIKNEFINLCYKKVVRVYKKIV